MVHRSSTSRCEASGIGRSSGTYHRTFRASDGVFRNRAQVADGVRNSFMTASAALLDPTMRTNIYSSQPLAEEQFVRQVRQRALQAQAQMLRRRSLAELRESREDSRGRSQGQDRSPGVGEGEDEEVQILEGTDSSSQSSNDIRMPANQRLSQGRATSGSVSASASVVRVKKNAVDLTSATEAVKSLSDAVRSAQRVLNVLSHRRAAERAHAGASLSESENIASADCPICFDTLTHPSAVVTACGHVFHDRCILQAAECKRNPECPLCRRQLHSAELTQLMNGLPELAAEQGAESAKTAATEEVIDLTGEGNGNRNASAKECMGKTLDEELVRTMTSLRECVDAGEKVRELELALLETRENIEKEAKVAAGVAEKEFAEMKRTINKELSEARKQNAYATAARKEARELQQNAREELAQCKERADNLEMEKARLHAQSLDVQKKRELVAAEREKMQESMKTLDKLASERAEKAVRASNRETARWKKLYEELQRKAANGIMHNNARDNPSASAVAVAGSNVRTLHSDENDNDDLTAKLRLSLDDDVVSGNDRTTKSCEQKRTCADSHGDAGEEDEEDAQKEDSDVEDVVGALDKAHDRARAREKRKRTSALQRASSNEQTLASRAFGSSHALRKPTPNNWPKKPRYSTANASNAPGLHSFAPKRATVQRPSLAVASTSALTKNIPTQRQAAASATGLHASTGAQRYARIDRNGQYESPVVLGKRNARSMGSTEKDGPPPQRRAFARPKTQQHLQQRSVLGMLKGG